MKKFDEFIKLSPDPDTAELRLSHLLKEKQINNFVNELNESSLTVFFRLITISNFLYHFIFRHPHVLNNLIQKPKINNSELNEINDASALRLFKYQSLLDITWQDLSSTGPYQHILESLSLLADGIICKTLSLLLSEQTPSKNQNPSIPICIFAMGKLGAFELNFSSDVDLVFVCEDEDSVDNNFDEEQLKNTQLIRKFSRFLTDITEDGFLYRVDMNIRPLGRSGPLVLSVSDTENYYSASTEAWERFAWLRARIIAGNQSLGEDLLQRLKPFIYMRTLSSDDLDRFLQIKKDMLVSRQKTDCWNIKLGEGGIRDIEFFVQILQIANAHQHPVLQSTNTLTILNGLVKQNFLDEEEGNDIRDSYLFLRRLENRLQMIDEKQTHELPHDEKQRLKIARSFGYTGDDNKENLESFDAKLAQHQKIASRCYEQILPGN